MPKPPPKPLRPNTSPVDAANYLRRHMSPAYQARIPEATKANIQQTIRDMWEYAPNRNEFISAFVNRIGAVFAHSVTFQNRFGKFKRGMLTYGDTIEEVAFGLVQPIGYDNTREYMEKWLFGTFTPEAQSSFHKINREHVYPITIDENLLRRAFLEEGPINDTTAQIMQSVVTSDEWDEFNIMVNLLTEFDRLDGFFKVQIPDVSAATSTDDEAKVALRVLREYAETLQLLSYRYNPAKMPSLANPDDLELFVTPKFKAAIDVNALAGLFNVEYGQVPYRITVVPEDSVRGIAGFQAVLTTRAFFVAADTLYETSQQFNAVTLRTNHYLHRQGIYSVSRFVPAILFTTEQGSPIELYEPDVVDLSPIAILFGDGDDAVEVEQVVRGKAYSIMGTAITDPEGGPNDSVRIEVVGKLSQFTRWNQSGTLVIGHDEDSSSIIVRIISTEDNSLVEERIYPIIGQKIEFWPPSDNESPEVTPNAPTRAGNNITIVPTTGIIYRNKADNSVVSGIVPVTSGTLTIIATPDSDHVIADGATTEWPFVHTP